MAKKKPGKTAREQDPRRTCEAKKYDNPIPSREFILGVLEKQGVPMWRDELAVSLNLSDEQDVEALRRRLNAMERDGQLVRNRRGAFCIVNAKDLIAGRVIGHPDGFGFLKPDEGGEDLFLTPHQMRQVLHGDRAVVRVVGVDQRGRKEGALAEVLEHANRQVVGRFYQEAGVGFVVPDNKRINQGIVVPEADRQGAGYGQMVMAEIVEQPTKRTQPIGRIVEVLGDHMAPGMETDVAIRTHDLPVEWPEEVEVAIAGLGGEVPEEAKEGRVDLRNLPLVTIDGADARDFDDAVYCEAKPKGWKLLVCIADVSAYVEPGTALDREARQRGNSVYFPGRVIPMLPEVLSNGLCSLNPEVDRLCMVCEMFIDKEGKIARSSFYEGVMRSHARLTYDQVADMLAEGEPKLCEQYADLLPHLHGLYALYQVLHGARSVRGAIDFDTTETRILFNKEQKVERVVPLIRNDAHKLIEECMLAANVAAACLLLRKKQPGLYRIHDGPQAEKLLDLREFLGELGLGLGGGAKPTAKDYADLLDSVADRPDRHLIQTVLLRSMSQAVYSSENSGHFGLAFPAYAHFTSPIRRYPDLVVHRAIKHQLNGMGADEFEYSPTELQGLGESCSATERRADEATRDAISWLKCEYMMDKLGESFEGIITSVTSFGIFVELDEIYVDGLVHITALDNDYYHFDPVGHRLAGERTGQVYRLGDQVKIKVAAVNLDDRKIDFVLDGNAEVEDEGSRSKRSRRAKQYKSGSRTETAGRKKPAKKEGDKSRKKPKKDKKPKKSKSGKSDKGKEKKGAKRGHRKSRK
ncbi:ribonuclease R [Solemya velesiana gill symbiont]|uniref:Ribonuclease R n=1 Tax=Solemya velesiana gill symbiont TaxID=1918948 RepID=A0A1T2KPN3_9GAMM|nr:ribonuclease R [Solemya velesiana gill symbiont]OOZ34772.1 ribonuclease R [Solemya velesiana gill symbiont]